MTPTCIHVQDYSESFRTYMGLRTKVSVTLAVNAVWTCNETSLTYLTSCSGPYL